MIIRENAIHNILNEVKDGLVICSNGNIGRELFETRIRRDELPYDFYMLGSTGCALGIAIGMALNTDKQVYCILGDGNFLAGLGTMATYLKLRPDNLHVYVLDNGCYDSAGGQPSSMSAIAPYLPFLNIIEVESATRMDLGKILFSPKEIKKNFMSKAKSLQNQEVV